MGVRGVYGSDLIEPGIHAGDLNSLERLSRVVTCLYLTLKR